MLHLEETDEFDFLPAEKYVAEKLHARGDPSSRWFDFFPIRQALVLRRTANARSAMVRALRFGPAPCFTWPLISWLWLLLRFCLPR